MRVAMVALTLVLGAVKHHHAPIRHHHHHHRITIKHVVAPVPATAPTPAPVALAPPSPPPPPAVAVVAPTVTHLHVSAREYTLTLSHPQIAAGTAAIELQDAGQDPHDLHIRPALGGPDVAAFGVVAAGTRSDQTIALAPGSYTLYCALAGHEALGMHATLTVG